tara:strand:- start:1797 stop:2129 length:333 start_codon:yes stop_codon:yes gene_type:complete
MKKETFETFTQGLYEDLIQVLKDKNNDYTAGSSSAFANFDASRDYGVPPLIGLCVRMGDKVKRVQTFCKNKTLSVEGEHVQDAFKDIIGYCTIALAMIKEDKKQNEINYP